MCDTISGQEINEWYRKREGNLQMFEVGGEFPENLLKDKITLYKY